MAQEGDEGRAAGAVGGLGGFPDLAGSVDPPPPPTIQNPSAGTPRLKSLDRRICDRGRCGRRCQPKPSVFGRGETCLWSPQHPLPRRTEWLGHGCQSSIALDPPACRTPAPPRPGTGSPLEGSAPRRSAPSRSRSGRAHRGAAPPRHFNPVHPPLVRLEAASVRTAICI